MQNSVIKFLENNKPTSISVTSRKDILKGYVKVGVSSYFKIGKEFKIQNVCDGLIQIKRLCSEHKYQIKYFKCKTTAEKVSLVGICKYFVEEKTSNGFSLHALEKLLKVLTELSGELFNLRF